MTGFTDSELLQAYARDRQEAAFAELVRRHVNFVYSAALRMVRDAHLAEDATQCVFVVLARNASQLVERQFLAGWLHRTTRNIAAQSVRTIERRRQREKEAVTMNELLSAAPEPAWEEIANHLDESLLELDEADRDAVLLRYFERKTAAEIGRRHGISDEAAQKRVSRAVEKLRDFLAARGVAVGTGGLIALVSARAVQAAPAGLPGASTAAALAGTAVHTSTLIAAKTIAMTTLQKIAVTAALAATIGAAVYESQQANAARGKNRQLQAQLAPLAEQVQKTEASLTDATNRLADLMAENSRLKSNRPEHELLQLRGENSRLQTNTKELVKVKTAQKSIQTMMLAQAKENMAKMMAFRATELTEALALTPAQASSVKQNLAATGDARMQLTSEVLSGSVQKDEALRRLAEIKSDQESKLVALLSPDQQTTYQKWRVDDAQTTVKYFAERELKAMQKSLPLTDEQAANVRSALLALPPSEDDGGTVAIETGLVRAELEARVQALANALTPDQLQSYRGQQLDLLAKREAAVREFQVMFKRQ